MTVLTCAIQFGSSSIRAIAAQKDPQTGTLSNIQFESELSKGCISHGYVANVEQTAMHLRSIIQKLGNRTRANIAAAYVSVGGFSLHSLRQQPSVQIPGYDVLYNEPLGNGEYQLVVGSKQLCEGIKAAMNRANIRLLGFIALPLATARILSAEERQKGCLLVDMGAATTTVSIYKGGSLQHLAVIPLGGQSVTYDIQSTGCSYDDAERIKIDWSDVSKEGFKESADNNTVSTLFGDKTLPIPQSKLNNIALCRYEEIAANIQHQLVASGLKDNLEGGCIITGGVALQKGITSLLRRRLTIGSVETRAYREPFYPGSERKPQLTNLLGMLAFCSENCAAEAKPVEIPKPATPKQTAQPATDNGASDKEKPLFPEVPEPEEETDWGTEGKPHTFKENFLRFAKDLFSGQN